MNYSEEEKEAIEYLKKYTQWETHGERSLETDILTVLNLIQKQDKIINDIKFITYNNKPHITQEKLIEYFKKEVERK